MPGLSDINSGVRRYLELRIDEMKLKAVDGLSVGLSSLLALITILTVGAIAAIGIAFGLVLLLGDLIGNLAVAVLIVSGVFLILFVILILLRKRLFRNYFVRLLISIFYEK